MLKTMLDRLWVMHDETKSLFAFTPRASARAGSRPAFDLDQPYDTNVRNISACLWQVLTNVS